MPYFFGFRGCCGILRRDPFRSWVNKTNPDCASRSGRLLSLSAAIGRIPEGTEAIEGNFRHAILSSRFLSFAFIPSPGPYAKDLRKPDLFRRTSRRSPLFRRSPIGSANCYTASRAARRGSSAPPPAGRETGQRQIPPRKMRRPERR